MTLSKTCDGVKRRDFLKAGVLGGASINLATYLKMADAGQVNENAKAKSAIFINLTGGPTHMDTFDLKPNAPEEYRGDFKPIKTNVAGIEISEHLPKLAQSMDKFTILRGVTHTLGAHRLGQEYVTTGNRPLPALEFPGLGAVVTKERPGELDLPSFVAVPNTNMKGGYLGVKYNPLNTGATPRAGQPFSVRGLTLGNGLTVADVEKRQRLLKGLDTELRSVEADNELLAGLDRFGKEAHAMITSKRARNAFDISKESPDFAKKYGETPFGQSALLATRLVESGVRFVTLTYGGWDTHRDNWNRLETRQLPPFDEGLSALFTGLEEKGLLDSTTVYVTGEFGRTPKINTERVGRDHYPRCMFMLMAGGGIKGGRVLGESDDKGTLPVDEGYSPDSVAASFFHSLGIDHTTEYQTTTGRPVMITRHGEVIEELFA
jgi:hypothetical protein